MLEISSEMIAKMKGVDHRLRELYGDSFSEKKKIREQLLEAGAQISTLSHLSKDELTQILSGKEVAAVDGSVNQTKGEEPHIIYLFQALAKTVSGEKAFLTELFSPLIDEYDEEELTSNIRKHILAKLELEVAYELIERCKPRLLIMDGALYHYRIDAVEEWEKLHAKALEEDVLLVGVSEEITTENLSKLSPFHDHIKAKKVFDRDLLFGILEVGEMVYIEEIQKKAGLESMWVRFSMNPAISGFDMLIEQAAEKEKIARLLYTITPQQGRGIPLLLDFVDEEVRVTDRMVEVLVEQYINPSIRQRLFMKKRHDRPY